MFATRRAIDGTWLNGQSDYQVGGRYGALLQQYRFTKSDQHTLKQLQEKLSPLYEKLQPHYPQTIAYLKVSLTAERTSQYAEKLHTLAVPSHEIVLVVTTALLEVLRLKGKEASSYIQTLQRAVAIDDTYKRQREFDAQLAQQDHRFTAERQVWEQKLAQLSNNNEPLAQVEHVQHALRLTEDMTSSIAEIARQSHTIAAHTKETLQKAEKGQNVLSIALAQIIESGMNFDVIVEKFGQLQQYITAIEGVVRLINEIADQTNLLALNASIEAARAGEHGKGFAVVASEVRKLAENTVQSLQAVNQNVGQLRHFSSDVAQSITSTSEIVRTATFEASEAIPMLTEMTQKINEIHQEVESSASETEQQASAVDELTQRLQQIEQLAAAIADQERLLYV